MKNNNPAFPRQGYYPDDPNERMESGERMSLFTEPQEGMSKRFYAACFAMQGLLSKYTLKEPSDQDTLIRMSYELADELLKQENL